LTTSLIYTNIMDCMKKIFIILLVIFVCAACSDTTAINNVPVAFAGFDRSIIVTLNQTEVELDGTGSYDPDSDLLTYKWSIEAIPEKSRLTEITNANNPIASFVPDAEGDYVFSLSVDDGVFTSQKDIVVITVIAK